MTAVHECPVDGCEYESDSTQGVTVHLAQSSKHEDEDVQYPTNEMLLTEIQRLADELGKTPTGKDMRESGKYSYSTYHNRFGSWNKALHKAGLNMNMEMGISKDNLVDELQQLADELDRTPTKREMNDSGKYSYSTYVERFGSWNEALQKAGFEVNVETDISTDDLLSELQRLADKLGRSPMGEEMNKHGTYSSRLYINRFGSWNNALEEAGLETNDISDSDLLSELQRLADELGTTPTQKDMEGGGKYSFPTYQDRFGTWNKALHKAGLDVNIEMGISKDNLLTELQRLADQLGKTPKMEDMRRGGKYSVTTYQRRFGSWNNALQKAGLEVKYPQWGNADSGFSKSPEGKAWRKAVFQRDEYTCQDCGRTHTELHAHHINRRVDSPDLETMVWNGVTLCQACHAKRHSNEQVYELLNSTVTGEDYRERADKLTDRGHPYFIDHWDEIPFARNKSNEPLVDTQ